MQAIKRSREDDWEGLSPLVDFDLEVNLLDTGERVLKSAKRTLFAMGEGVLPPMPEMRARVMHVQPVTELVFDANTGPYRVDQLLTCDLSCTKSLDVSRATLPFILRLPEVLSRTTTLKRLSMGGHSISQVVVQALAESQCQLRRLDLGEVSELPRPQFDDLKSFSEWMNTQENLESLTLAGRSWLVGSEEQALLFTNVQEIDIGHTPVTNTGAQRIVEQGADLTSLSLLQTMVTSIAWLLESENAINLEQLALPPTIPANEVGRVLEKLKWLNLLVVDEAGPEVIDALIGQGSDRLQYLSLLNANGMTPERYRALLTAFPALKTLKIRGGSKLALSVIESTPHEKLEHLEVPINRGGLSALKSLSSWPQ